MISYGFPMIFPGFSGAKNPCCPATPWLCAMRSARRRSLVEPQRLGVLEAEKSMEDAWDVCGILYIYVCMCMFLVVYVYMYIYNYQYICLIINVLYIYIIAPPNVDVHEGKNHLVGSQLQFNSQQPKSKPVARTGHGTDH